jgi:hypothetical protein
MYTAIVLNESDRARLINDFTAVTFGHLPDGWVTRCHHVTINMGKIDEELNPMLEVKSDCHMIVGGHVIGWESGVIALTVNDMANPYLNHRNMVHSANRYPHITMFHHLETKPKEVNTFLESEGCAPEHLEGISGRLIRGKVQEVGFHF